jgi:malate dehydrogenase (quinone)
MVDLLERCFPTRVDAWRPQLRTMMPSLGGNDWDDSFEREGMSDDAQVGA